MTPVMDGRVGDAAYTYYGAPDLGVLIETMSGGGVTPTSVYPPG